MSPTWGWRKSSNPTGRAARPALFPSGGKMKSHKLLSGETVELPELDPAVESFLRRVHDALHDPTVSEDDMIELVYGRENPLLDQTIFADRGAVTKAVFANPAYHVMTDMIGQKRVQEGKLNIPRAYAQYTLTVAEAAERADVHESSIRQAIAAKRLPAIKQGSRWLLRPEDVDLYKPKPYPLREPQASPLRVRFGSAPGLRFSIKQANRELADMKREGAIIEGAITSWRRVGIISGRGGSEMRFWAIEPADEEQEITFEGFFVRGRFRIVERVRHSEKAREAWKTFKPE